MNSPKKSALEEYVLEATANDFESVASIAPDIKSWASKENSDVSVEHIADAIEDLVKGGKLKTYKFSKTTNRYEATPFNRKDIDDLWFRSR